jgi:hypothetical protein
LVKDGERPIVEDRVAAPEADLREPRAAADDDRKRARADLQIERPGIALRHLVEGTRAVRDDPREDVEAAGRALRVGARGDVFGEIEGLQERRDVDAAGLQHRAVSQVELVQRQLRELRRHVEIRTRQEARAHPPGLVAEPEIEGRRLDLVRRERAPEADMPSPCQRPDRLVREDAPVLFLMVHLSPKY